MKFMKAIFLKERGKPPVLAQYADPKPSGAGQALVKVLACSLNHRDLWILKGKYPGVKPPVVLGSDLVGMWNGKRVVVQPGINWGPNPEVQSKNYHILGVPHDGAFADLVLVPSSNVFEAPSHLTDEEAAALPLAGITAYRVLFTKCAIKSGERILITGAGGGVALTCVQFALAAGLEVWVTSGSDEKIEKAKKLGASGGVNYRNQDWSEALARTAGKFDVIIDSAGGDGFQRLLSLAAPAARIGIYGGGMGVINGVSPQILFWKQLKIFGSTMGTNAEFEDMLRFVSEHKLNPVVDSVWNKEDFEKAFDRMENAEQFGKIVLRWV
jgi:NADPH:quinone reductase-like Zn-dependent oxidoreductase